MSCEEAHPNENKLFWNQTTESCVETCPETHIGTLCQSCEYAARDRPYWNATAKTCQSCTEAYPGENRKWDANTHSCVDKCPEGAPENE